ncbi:TonB-dependent receptor [Fulvivirga sp. RKSG066]|uniref:SusC/RagA family TonB-linked outer membrane protein n=1 Tax=Fulvivirga aurantia TaxID=2529383 RepID=UPI0012BD6594|nr:TonB-dependent receptor [Fulvivirga aurantia]MTI22938.1 TonB-dependent receptor [Fulvivirga aurantia]
MTKILRLVGMLALLLYMPQVYAQTNTVSGQVVSIDNEPLPGVNVLLEGTSQGTVTDADGNYSVVASSDDVLIFSFIGFETQRAPVGAQSVINITLEEDITSLQEVVVIGYGTQSERNLTSAISTVKSEEIVKTPTSQAMQALQGKVAGVQIVSNGNPGGSPTVRVRGIGSFPGSDDGQPLYVVDGMFFDNLDFLNTADIESISVLKDASASAIYGVRAANGVVLIETKAGKYNQKTSITYNGYYGVQVPQNVLKMSNTEQFVNYINQYTEQSGNSADASFIDEAIQRYGRSRVNPNLPDVNTDWYAEVLKEAAPIQNHTIDISGGNENARYSVGASYFEQEGLLEEIRNSYERINFRTKVDVRANDWLTVGGNAIISNAKQFNAENGVWFQTYFAVPHLPVIDEENGASPIPLANARRLGYRGVQNPYFNLYYNDNRANIGKILGNFYADIQLLPEKLSFKTTYNYNYENVVNRNVDFEYNIESVPDTVVQNPNGITRVNSTSCNEIWDNVLTYEDNFNNHGITAQIGYSYRSEITEGARVRGTEISTLDPRLESTWFIPTGENIDADNSNDFGSRIFGSSYFARLSYNYSEKYLLYGTYRRDGSNKFQQKWGDFFTFGAGWIISEENFFDVGVIDFLKIRGSWGQLGNDGVVPAVGQPTLNQTSTAINDQLIGGLVVDNTFSTVDKWETVVETNIGLSVEALKSRLSLEADYYIRDTEDAVIPIILPSNRATVLRNAGDFRNQGLEVALNWNDRLGTNVRYSLGLNFATLKNEVLDLNGQSFIDGGTAEFRQRSSPGQSFNEFYGYEVEGVFQTTEDVNASGYDADFITNNNIVPGDFQFRDQNGDGVIDANDRVFLGSFLPDITYGFNLGVSYKALSLSMDFQGQAGNKILNRKRGEIIFTQDPNIDADLATNLWNGPGTSNKYPSAAGYRKPYNTNQISDFYVEDGDYFRIQNIRLSYNIVNQSLLGVSMPNTTISFTAERPLTVFDYNGFNPEVANGIDRQTYPIPAIYTIGLNVKL